MYSNINSLEFRLGKSFLFEEYGSQQYFSVIEQQTAPAKFNGEKIA